MSETLPIISVVIPIRNEERFIARTIRYLLEQDYPADRMEVLVVDGESDDRTVEIVTAIAKEDSRVRLLHNPRRLSSAARNVGSRAARGEIITFVDGHTYIDNRHLLRNTARLMAEKDVQVLSRPQFLETLENTEFQTAVALARRSTIGHGLDSTIYTSRDAYVNPTSSGATYHRDVFNDVGYFDERFDACEDVEFNYRVHLSGRSAFTSLKVAVYYYPRESVGRLFTQMKRYGTGRFRLARKHPATLAPGTLIPALFTAGLFGLLFLSLLLPHVGWILLGLYGLYAFMIFLSSATIAGRHGSHLLADLLVIYPTIHLGLGWGFLSELVRTMMGKGVDMSAAVVDESADAGKQAPSISER
ncbi:MAG: glycosyltransferase family 2 protein [candidate division Zixibacteria bacterium]|jgi:glycosyltransferase involved in cell wall biosynthesis|nr:glycosyltransferase family 2 protein [candidate division Zixibacteria bacterium]